MMHALGGWKSCWRRPACTVAHLAVIALSVAGCGGDAPKPPATPSTAEADSATTKALSPAAKKAQSNMTAQEKRALRKKDSGG